MVLVMEVVMVGVGSSRSEVAGYGGVFCMYSMDWLYMNWETKVFLLLQ